MNENLKKLSSWFFFYETPLNSSCVFSYHLASGRQTFSNWIPKNQGDERRNNVINYFESKAPEHKNKPSDTLVQQILRRDGEWVRRIMEKEALDKGGRISHFMYGMAEFSYVEKEVYSNYVKSR